MEIRLTQFSHGAGCGCKIAPGVLEHILSEHKAHGDGRLVVGNATRDDAAVYDLENGQGLISTTDFFMPIVDDPQTFGRIAAANAISDVYAMAGRPILAIAILGWPIDKIPAEVAGRVIDGGRLACTEAGIALAGGHSIDSPEPIFGLAVNGLVDLRHLKRNDTARSGDVLLLTKPLGVGILTTAEKRGLLRPKDVDLAARQMVTLNRVGEALGPIAGVHAVTDVTGFGLLGHLLEMCEGSGLGAEIWVDRIPLITDLGFYLDHGCTPGGTHRNWDAYGQSVESLDERSRWVLCDPQTSGGLLIAVDPSELDTVQRVLIAFGHAGFTEPLGQLCAAAPESPRVSLTRRIEF